MKKPALNAGFCILEGADSRVLHPRVARIGLREQAWRDASRGF
jgi:hypothetical protein